MDGGEAGSREDQTYQATAAARYDGRSRTDPQYGDVEGFAKRRVMTSKPLPKRLARDVLHRDELLTIGRLAKCVNRADIRVVERRGGTRFLAEASHSPRIQRETRGQELERDRSLKREVACKIDLPHPAGTDSFNDFVVTKPRTGRDDGLYRHRGNGVCSCRRMLEEVRRNAVVREQRLDLAPHGGIAATGLHDERGSLS